MEHRKHFHSSTIPAKNKIYSANKPSSETPQFFFAEIPQSLPPGSIGYLAFPDQADFLRSELKNRCGIPPQTLENAHRFGNLFIFEPDSVPEQMKGPRPHLVPYWCSTVLLEPHIVSFASIGEAAARLRAIQRNWAPYRITAFRRGQLIQDKLPYMNLKPRTFPFSVPTSNAGLYSLLDQNTLLVSGKTTSPFPAGLIQFQEDHEHPPSRAYLKLQEALTQSQACFGRMPQAGQRCLDAGACPGGWTWVLVQLGCEVFAVDRSPLAPSLMGSDLVQFQRHDAFTLRPQDVGPFDWVFSDVICYPARLLEWIHRWLDSGLCKNMVCTIKMQGEIDWNLIRRFESIPSSRIFHLHYNKHELTWICCQD